MPNELLVLANKYSNKIRFLNILNRIEIEYPILVRDSVAKKLAHVAQNLPDNLILQIDCGYRSLKTQQKLWNIRQNKITQNLTFDPKSGTPPHTTGGAVDLALLDENCNQINLSAPLKNYYDEPQLKSSKISAESQSLRNQLHNLLLAEGFAANPREYWHFSYGDNDWAKHFHKKNLYKGIENYEKLKFSLIPIILIKIGLRIKKLMRGNLGD